MRNNKTSEYFLNLLMHKFGNSQEFDIVDIVDCIDSFLTFFIATADNKDKMNDLIQSRIKKINDCIEVEYNNENK